MNLLGHRSSRAEGRLEDWIEQRHQERVLSGQTQPLGQCLDDAFLRALARRSKAIPLSDAKIDHTATCPNCMSRVMSLRVEYRSRRRKLAFATAAVACLILAVGLIVWSQYEGRPTQTLALAPPVSKTVDLWNSGTYRGKQLSPPQPIVLHAARLRLTIILPRFSTSGRYLVAITRDQSGNGVVAEGAASAVGTGEQEIISVDLDLRRIRNGAYFLSTTHEQDQAAYYYPLQIK